MAERILSISGLRGIIGNGLDPAFLVEFAAAVGTMAGASGKVVVSRDGRSTGPMIHSAVTAGLMATGCRVLDAGIVSTPTCGVLVQELGCAAGLQITASHNPIEWNGLKPFSEAGSVLNEEQGKKLLKILEERSFRWVDWSQLGTIETITDPFAPHLTRVLGLVPTDRIASRKFRVVLDVNHGSGATGGVRLLERLGCAVTLLGGTPDGRFDHPPEPLAENLTALSAKVRELGADVGFAQDPDADRLAVIDNTGRYIGEELTLALAVDYVLPRRPGPIVVNGSTSRVSADLAEKYGCPFHRSYVGEAHVVTKMKSVGAIIGGEGNGGVIEPRVGYVRDSFVSMAYVLAHLTESGRSLNELVDQLPQYSIVKDKLTCPRERVSLACQALREKYAEAVASEGDGLRLDWPDRWVQVRASNTEPILRVIAEAPGDEVARNLCQEAIELVRTTVT